MGVRLQTIVKIDTKLFDGVAQYNRRVINLDTSVTKDL